MNQSNAKVQSQDIQVLLKNTGMHMHKASSNGVRCRCSYNPDAEYHNAPGPMLVTRREIILFLQGVDTGYVAAEYAAIANK